MIKGLIFITTIISILYIIACINKYETELNELWRSICYIMFKPTAVFFFDFFVKQKIENVVYAMFVMIMPLLLFIPISLVVMFISFGYLFIIAPVYAVWLELHVFGLLMVTHIFLSIWYPLYPYNIHKNIYLVLKLFLLGCLMSYFILYTLSLTFRIK